MREEYIVIYFFYLIKDEFFLLVKMSKFLLRELVGIF